MKKVITRITPKGEVTVEVEGVVGDSCQGLTKELLEKLGKVKEETLLPEYFEQKQKDNLFN